jgi:pimeloyl-ACP methyl ester carboxylesterase
MSITTHNNKFQRTENSEPSNNPISTNSIKIRKNISIMSVKSVKSSDVFTEEELETITICYGDSKPKGNFIQDRHGFTHYKIDGKEQQGPMVVMSHGLGTSTNAFEAVAAELVNSGFKVLRYDFYGHGYSKYGGRRTYWKYDNDMLVDQLEDLLDYVEQEEVTGVQQGTTTIVGHSTGGVVAIEANRRWLKDDSKRDIVPSIILVAPAIYVKKVSDCWT